MDMSEFDNDKSIEPGQLEVEAVRQADTFFKWAERLIAAKAEVDRQKLAMDILEAKLQLDIRRNPQDFDLDKATEAAILATVKIHPKYIAAYDNFLKAREVAALLEKATEAMEQKKRMIEVLVTLHGQQYFAGPSVPRNIVETWATFQKAASQRVNDKQATQARRRVQRGA